MKCKDCLSELVKKIEDKTLPFSEETVSDTVKIRTFDSNYPDHLFKWHWDDEDRYISAVEDTDWKFQFDNELPIKITSKVIFIPRGVYHRLIKGTGKLKLYINLNE